MKRITWLATTAAFLLAVGLNGCTKEQGGENGKKGEPCRLALTANAIDLYNTVTKADNAAEVLPENSEVGVHIVDLTSKETIATAKFANLKHQSDASGALSLVGSEQPIILTTGYTYDIYSYSPYQEGLTSETISTIPVSHGTDILWAKAAGEKPNAATHSTTLTFEHKMAQVEFQVVADAVSEPDITGATLKVTGFYKDGALDLATGKVKPGEGSAVDNTIELTEFGQAICFLPIDGEMELAVEVTIPAGDNAGVYSGTVKKTFVAGQSNLITITVIDRNSSLGLEAGLIPWVEKTGDVDVTN